MGNDNMEIEFVRPDGNGKMRIDFDGSTEDGKAGAKDEIVISQQEITGELSPL
jgi:hypothetical protein